ncbi:hypothetical protein D6821_01380 [Candidatus Parcubacteria bacterium]|nr:MAG: hypothetical protein D6821_01380 [Candidatus Parcubacteria bacterium]
MIALIKKLPNQILRPRGATTLIIAVSLTSAMLVGAIVINDIVLNELRTAYQRVYSVKSFLAAESGAEWLLGEIMQNDSFINEPTCGGPVLGKVYVNFSTKQCVNLSGGDSDALSNPDYHRSLNDGAVFYIRLVADQIYISYGAYEDTRRAIQISF